jgi:hypothetical protein
MDGGKAMRHGDEQAEGSILHFKTLGTMPRQPTLY